MTRATVLVAFAALAAAAAADYYPATTKYPEVTVAPPKYPEHTVAPPKYPEHTVAPPKCYAVGERCIGAAHHPYVQPYGCCGTATCTGKDAHYGYVCEAHKDYGYVATPDYPTCRAKGEKCEGAPGYPYVKWIPCCDGYSCSGKAKDWGKVCAKEAYEPHYYGEEPPKCRKEGDKCIGAYGYPAVEWIPCCDYMSCTKKAHDWGYVCEKKDYVTPPKKDYVAPPEKCSKDKCGDHMKCCDGYKCVMKPYDGYGDKYYYCKKDVVTPPPKCDIKDCTKDKKCCPGYKCEMKPYEGYGDKYYYCKKIVVTPPPKCDIKDCTKDKKCCPGYKCEMKPYEGYGDKYYYCKKIVVTPPPKCDIKDCTKDKKCCPGYKCEMKPYEGYGDKYYYCKKEIVVTPPPKCLKEYAECGDKYDPCCEGYKCADKPHGYGKYCVKIDPPTKY